MSELRLLNKLTSQYPSTLCQNDVGRVCSISGRRGQYRGAKGIDDIANHIKRGYFYREGWLL